MELTRRDIDQIITEFYARPTSDAYFTVNQWYSNNSAYPDNEYLICIYLFLLGANIKNRFTKIEYDQHLQHVKEIRDYVESAITILKPQRKAYLDYGLKSGTS